MNRTEVREALRDIYGAAVSAVSGSHVVSEYLTDHPPTGHTHLVAIGKAASSMCQGALKAMGGQIVDGIVITKHGHLGGALSDDPRLLCLETDHPVPGEASLVAGRSLIDFLRHSPSSARFLFLISGGASSLVEVLPPSLTLSGLKKINDSLLAGGLSIAEMNSVRKAVSLIKGGGLLSYLGEREATALLISDVPGDDPAVIGSGLLVPDAEQRPLPPLPHDVAKLLKAQDFGKHVLKSHPARVSIKIVATLEDAKQAAARQAEQLGYIASVHPEFLQGDVEKAAVTVAERLRQAEPGVHIWGGETTVDLPTEPGRGGRNQHLALALAQELRAAKGICVLAAGTDGTDGPTDDAGGLIDSGTLARGEARSLDAHTCLKGADAGRFLVASGDLLHTGPTGTNVMDLVIAYKCKVYR